ncbi:MAG TPA: PriCT-2 domain-containing protein, partial [Stenomitos sp.]
MTHPLRFSFAVNRYGTDKLWDYKLLAGKFEDCQGTIAEVQHHIRRGHALCAGLLNGQWRSKANVIGSQWILLDIDNSKGLTDTNGNPLDDQGRPIRIGRQNVDIYGNPIPHSDGRKQGKVFDHQLTIEDAIAHPFIRNHAALIYTSASHQPDWHKFRLVFLLPQFVEGSDTIEALVRYLMEQLPHDPACKDASRVFYGNTRAEFPLINESAVLPTEWIERAKIAAAQEKIEQERRLEEVLTRRAQFQAVADRQGWDFDALVEEALSYIPPRQVGGGNYDECRQVLMALHFQYGEAAEVIAERWSPSLKGTTWNIPQKLKSFRRSNGIGIGTLFHIARQYGFKFPDSQPKEEATDTPYLEWLNEQFKIDAVQDELQADKDFFSKVVRYFGGGKKRKKTRKRVTPERSTNLIELGTYSTGMIPQFQQSGSAYKIWYQPGTEAQLYQEAIAHGYHILDISPTGSGKTQRAGQLQPSDFTFDQEGQYIEPTLIYLGSDHRNPKTASVESNFVDVPNRHNGMVIDSSRKTA